MSHLGDLLSALVDGELSGADRDRASAHLAHCEQCRDGAASLRELKGELRSLGSAPLDEADGDTAMIQRLLAISELAAAAGPSGPLRQRRHRVMPARALPGPRPAQGPGGPLGPSGPGRPAGPRLSKRNRRFLVVGAMSIVVTLGTAAFSVGGTDSAPGPRITPQYELYSEEHAITTGEVPYTGPPAGSGTSDALESTGPAQEP
jgi:anti-sigma factor RsiW